MIIVQTVIGTDGRMRDLTFVKSPPSPCVEQRIRQSFATWRFRPAQLNGQPVAAYYNLTTNIHFR